MDHQLAAPENRQQRVRRGFFFAVILLMAFAIGAGGMLWLGSDSALHPEKIATIDMVAPVSIQIAAIPPKVEPPEVFDFRGHSRGSSDNPRRLAQQYEESTAMAVAPSVAPHPQRPSLRGQDKPRIAIVIDDVGPDFRAAKEAIGMPQFVSLSFLPYAEHLPQLAAAAKEAGHEIMVHMPMEPDDVQNNNPGPGVLLTAQTTDEIKERLDKALSSFSGYVGVNNHMGSRFTANRAGMSIVLNELRRRNLFFLDSRTTPESTAADLAARLSLRFVGRDVFLDNEISTAAVTKQLEQLERIAKRNGSAVAIGHPHKETFSAIKAWVSQARADGFDLVPVSRLAERPAKALLAAE